MKSESVAISTRIPVKEGLRLLPSIEQRTKISVVNCGIQELNGDSDCLNLPTLAGLEAGPGVGRQLKGTTPGQGCHLQRGWRSVLH